MPVLRLLQLVDGFSRRRCEFDSWLFHVRFVVGKKALGMILLRTLHIFPVSIIHQYSMPMILKLLLSEGQAGEEWTPSIKTMRSQKSENTGEKSTFSLIFFMLEYCTVS